MNDEPTDAGHRPDAGEPPAVPDPTGPGETLALPEPPAPTADTVPVGSAAPMAGPASVASLAPVPPARPGIRMRTIVFGLVAAVISAIALLSLLAGVHVDRGVVGLIVMIAAGAALVGGAAAATVREARGGPGAP